MLHHISALLLLFHDCISTRCDALCLSDKCSTPPLPWTLLAAPQICTTGISLVLHPIMNGMAAFTSLDGSGAAQEVRLFPNVGSACNHALPWMGSTARCTLLAGTVVSYLRLAALSAHPALCCDGELR